LAESINHMTAQLKHLEAARAQFISEISHDLRTPLTAIKGLLVNLIDASGPGEQPSASSAGLQIRREQWKGEQTSLEIAERETDRLIRLVNQLLDFSRWQGGQLELNRRPVDVSAIARAAVTLSEGRAHHRNITLNTDIPLLDGRRACPERSRRAPTEPASLPTISADPDRLQQVILNLLDNAIKFTPSGGQVTLAVTQREGGALSGSTEPSSRAQAEGLAEVLSRGEIEVSVQDTGRGMSDEERERAFEPYYRGEGGGVGLGLTIARAIVEAHGGQMGIESSVGQGTRVWFTLRQAQDSALPL
jgi:signal transduction histidine kinase